MLIIPWVFRNGFVLSSVFKTDALRWDVFCCRYWLNASLLRLCRRRRCRFARGGRGRLQDGGDQTPHVAASQTPPISVFLVGGTGFNFLRLPQRQRE